MTFDTNKRIFFPLIPDKTFIIYHPQYETNNLSSSEFKFTIEAYGKNMRLPSNKFYPFRTFEDLGMF